MASRNTSDNSHWLPYLEFRAKWSINPNSPMVQLFSLHYDKETEVTLQGCPGLGQGVETLIKMADLLFPCDLLSIPLANKPSLLMETLLYLTLSDTTNGYGALKMQPVKN